MSISKERLAELLKRTREKKLTKESNEAKRLVPVLQELKELPVPEQLNQHTDRYGNIIQYNSKQQDFIDLALSGKSCILLGAAGTGKTTCMQGVLTALVQAGKLPPVTSVTHKYLPVSGYPGLLVTAFTRRAVANIKRAMPEDLKQNCLTTHKILEYQPVYYTVLDPETGEERNTMKFAPSRHQYNPLSSDFKTVVVEESSMMGVPLFEELKICLPSSTQYIFLGDIQQLPPVFGSAILGHKMLELPVIELTEVYRQALDSPIIALAHRILSGVPIKPEEFPDWNVSGKLTLHPWKKKLHADIATITAASFFTKAIASKLYDPEEDMILIPFNKSFGSLELNKHIAQHLAVSQGKKVHEIIAGFSKLYFAEGDKVLFDKEDAIIVSINLNPEYVGKTPTQASVTLDYWGHDSAPHKIAQESGATMSEEQIDFLLSQAASIDEDRVKSASHILTLQMLDSGQEVTLNTSSELNTLLHGYVLTVHKAQGSEWRKVFICLHQSHATMISRELLYTAVTRAREELYVICEPETFVNGILSQRIRGDTLEQKAEYFKGLLQERMT